MERRTNHILVVDDDNEISDLVRIHLETYGYIVYQAENGIVACQIILLHGGDISVSSEKEETSFVVVLPLVRESHLTESFSRANINKEHTKA